MNTTRKLNLSVNRKNNTYYASNKDKMREVFHDTILLHRLSRKEILEEDTKASLEKSLAKKAHWRNPIRGKKRTRFHMKQRMKNTSPAIENGRPRFVKPKELIALMPEQGERHKKKEKLEALHLMFEPIKETDLPTGEA